MRSEGETLTQVAPIHLGAHNHLTSEEEALKKKLESFSLSVLTQPRQETRFFPSLSARQLLLQGVRIKGEGTQSTLLWLLCLE